MAENCIASISQAMNQPLVKTNTDTPSENESSDENDEQKNDTIELLTPNSAEKCVLYLETPIVDGNVDENVASSTTKKLNRISDEFFSADDDDNDNNDDDDDNDNNDTKFKHTSQIFDILPNCEIKSSDKISLINVIAPESFQEENSTDDNVINRSTDRPVYTDDDDISSCSNLNIISSTNETNDSSPHSSGSTENINLNNNFDYATNHGNDENNIVDNNDDDDDDNAGDNVKNEHHIDENSSSINYSDQVQLIDAIERNDFEDEQKAIGNTIMKENLLISEKKRLNLEMLKIISNYDTNNTTDDDVSQESSSSSSSSSTKIKTTETSTAETVTTNKCLSTTPTSSRKKSDRSIVKSILKINFSDNLNDCSNIDNDDENLSINNSNNNLNQLNSNKSLLSDKSCQTHSFLDDDDDDDDATDNNINQECTNNLQYDDCHNNIASTSKSITDGNDCQSNCQYSNAASLTSTKTITTSSSPSSSSSTSSASIAKSSDNNKSQSNKNDVPNEDNKMFDENPSEKSNNFENNNDCEPTSSSSNIDTNSNQTATTTTTTTTTHMLVGVDPNQDYDEDTWADCEDVYDMEEICTCQDYSDEDAHASSEDELPSRDVDLSAYTHLDSISEDILHEGNSETPRNYRKRKITETCTSFCDGINDVPSSANRKRLALENIIMPKLPCTPTTPMPLSITSPTSSVTSSAMSEKRTPRSIIPTRDNPPPELSDWLLQFQRWSHVERLVAVDRLIEHCEPTQVRHMMKVIEPQFQRDFISLLPKELALQVLSYLEPRDLLRAAQTCRSWRFLCDDNLLWKEKCKKGAIVIEPTTDRPKRGRAGNMPPISSPWKAAYMRQHIIEVNWRSRPIKNPKILKGHDDHVITCLQFCGNRIVSGSDDNTLKVWSAITGKCLRTLVGHTGGVWSSQMAGNIIISGSTDRTLKVWNADTGLCNHTLYGHTSTVRCMHLHGRKVVSGSRDATLRVWDIVQGKCLHILVGHLAAVRCVQYDGKLVVSGAYDYMVKVWNPERQECLHTLQGHTNRVYSLQFDGVHVVSGSLDTSIRVWDAESGCCKHTLMGHQSLTSGMELRQNILVSGNADSTVKVWDITNGQCLQTLSGPNKHQSAVTCLQFNSRFVVTSSDDGTVKLWDVRTGEFIRNLITLDSGGSGGVVWRIRANDTKLICAVGSRNGTEETKLMALDFDVEGACLKCS